MNHPGDMNGDRKWFLEHQHIISGQLFTILTVKWRVMYPEHYEITMKLIPIEKI